MTWLITDALVLYGEFYADTEATSMWHSLGENSKFLTNQVWMFGVVAKLCFLYAVTHSADKVATDEGGNHHRGTVYSLFFLIYGVMLNAVLMTFFLLIYSTKTLLDAALDANKFTLSQILLWNHVRHVTPVVLHIIVVLIMRCHLRLSLANMSARGVGIILAGVSVVMGLLHSMVFDDRTLYKYGSTAVGQRCQLIFAVTSVATAAGFVFVITPIDASEATATAGTINVSTLIPSYPHVNQHVNEFVLVK